MKDVLSTAKERACAPLGPRRPWAVATSVLAGAPALSGSPDDADSPSPLEARRREERALMEAVVAGDQGAKSRLVARVLPGVLGRARSIARSPADAEDAAQTAMIEILKSAKSFCGKGSLGRWCDRITVRTTLRLQRREARTLALVESAVEPDSVAGEAPSRRMSEEIPGDLHAYLGELSEERVEVLVLRAQGWTIDEIAGLTGASSNTVKDRLRMARKQIRRSIRQREVVASMAPTEVQEGTP